MNITVTHTLAPEIIALLNSFTAMQSKTETLAPAALVAESTPVKQLDAVKAEKKATQKVEAPKAEAAEKITDVEVRAAGTAKARDGKRDEVKALLKEFGVENMSALKEEQYADFITKVNAL